MEEPRNALKGQQQLAQGNALGEKWEQTNALQGQKLLHFQRVLPHTALTQGDALGYERVGPSGRSLLEDIVQTLNYEL
jgi:hypothetical protein